MNSVLKVLEADAIGASVGLVSKPDIAALREALGASAATACYVSAPPHGSTADTTTLSDLAVMGVARLTGDERYGRSRSVDALRAQLAAPRTLVCFVATPSVARSTAAASRVA